MIAIGQGKEEKQHRVPHLIGVTHREYLGILYSACTQLLTVFSLRYSHPNVPNDSRHIHRD